MPVERGGLDYPIRIVDHFGSTLDALIDKLRLAREELEALKNAKGGSATDGETRATEALTNATSKLSKATKKLTEALSVQEKAQQRIADAIELRAVKQEEANIIAQEGIDLDTAAATQAEVARKAHQRVTKVLNERAIVAATAVDAAERLDNATASELKTLKLLPATQEKVKKSTDALTIATERLVKAKNLAARADVVQANAAASAQEKINRATQRAAEAEALLMRGRASSGAPLGAANVTIGGQSVAAFEAQQERIARAKAQSEAADDAAEKRQLVRQFKFGEAKVAAIEAADARAAKAAAQAQVRADLAEKRQLTGQFRLGRTKFEQDEAQRRRDEAAAVRAADRAKREQAAAEKAKEADRNASTLARSFQRVVTIAAFFAIGTRLVAGIRAAVVEAIEFNKELEQAQIGIAGIIAATGSIPGSINDAAGAAARLDIATAAAGDQIRKLRKDALSTTATFREMVQTFQVALAPGLQAGLNLDQIRRVSKDISIAAQAIGLEQSQLSEEIRSLLSGTIQQRQTRIATALGITNDDIRRAKDAGKLFEFITARFNAFEASGRKLANTVGGLQNRIKDAISQILGAGGKGLFEDFRAFLDDTLHTLLKIDEATGNFELNPNLVQAVRIVGDGFSVVLQEVRKFGKEMLGGGDLLAIAAFFRDMLKLVSGLFIGAIEGLIDAFKILGKVFGTSFNASNIRAVAREVVKFFTLWLAAKQGVGLLKGVGNELLNIVKLLERAKIIVEALAAAKSAGQLVSIIARLGAGGIKGIAAGTATGIATGTGAGVAEGVAAASTPGILKRLLNIFRGRAAAAGAAEGAGALGAGGAALTITGVVAVVASLFAADQIQAKLRGARSISGFEDTEGLKNAAGELTDIEGALRRSAARLGITGEKIADINDEMNKRRDALSKEIQRDRDAIAAATPKKNQDLVDFANQISKQLSSALAASATTLNNLPFSNPSSQDALDPRARIVSRVKRSFENIQNEAIGAFRNITAEITSAEEQGVKIPQERVDALRDMLSKLANEAVEKLDSAFGQFGSALILPPSEAIKTLEEQLGQLQLTAVKTANDLKARASLVGLSGNAKTLVEDGLNTTKEIETDLNKVYKERDGLLSRIKAIKAQIAEGEGDIDLLLSEQASIQDRIAELDKFSLVYTRERLALAVDELAVKAKELNYTQRIENAQKRVEALFADSLAISELKQDHLNQERLEIEREIELLRTKGREEQEAFQKSSAALAAQIALLKEKRRLDLESRGFFGVEQKGQTSPFDAAIRELEISAALTQDEFLAQAQINAALERNLQLRREINAVKLGGNSLDQIGLALELLDQELPTRFDTIMQTVVGIVNGATDLISNAIVDAFDPTKKVDLKERFGRFLQDIAREIIQTLVRIAVVKATLAIFGGGPIPFSGGGEVQSFSHGGTVRREPRSHRRWGYASGGSIEAFPRPANVPASDTVPAWLTPREWVIQRSSAEAYGHDVMKAINERRIDPFALRQMARIGARAANFSAVASRSPQSFAGGGSVRPFTPSAPSGHTGPSVVPTAVLRADDNTVETLLAGGKNAAIRLLDEWGFKR